MNARILVMAKAPIPGLAKTRLRLPPATAARLQEALIADTVNKARDLAPITVAGTPPESLNLIASLLPAGVELIPQPEGDLGQKMLAGAYHLFDGAPGPVIILGTDAPTLPPAYIERAVSALQNHDVSIVPSTDGGYVLIGLRAAHETVFANIEWSTGKVREQTLARARQVALALHETEPWYDVDEPEDLDRLKRDLEANPTLAPRTAALLKDLRT